MKSICIESVGNVVMKEQELPVPKEGEALLKILYGGICGSDLSAYRGKSPYVTYPRVPGHEFSAQILQLIRLAARPVGAASSTRRPAFFKAAIIPCVVVV